MGKSPPPVADPRLQNVYHNGPCDDSGHYEDEPAAPPSPPITAIDYPEVGASTADNGINLLDALRCTHITTFLGYQARCMNVCRA